MIKTLIIDENNSDWLALIQRPLLLTLRLGLSRLIDQKGVPCWLISSSRVRC